MKKTQHNSGTSLFLMEMILALLFLSLSSAACIQIFAAARKNRIRQNSGTRSRHSLLPPGKHWRVPMVLRQNFCPFFQAASKKRTI